MDFKVKTSVDNQNLNFTNNNTNNIRNNQNFNIVSSIESINLATFISANFTQIDKYNKLLKYYDERSESLFTFPGITKEEELSKIRRLLKIYDPNAEHKLNAITKEEQQYLIEHGKEILYKDQSYGEFGGSQSGLWGIYYYSGFVEYDESPENQWTADQIEIIVREYYPDMTDEELVEYLSAMSEVGCGYVACANYIFESYINKPEQFEKDFGFPMYYKRDDGTFKSNVNLLYVDIYCNANKRGLVEYRSTEAESTDLNSDIKFYPGDSNHNEGLTVEAEKKILEFYSAKYLGCNVSYNTIKEYLTLGDTYDLSGLTVGETIASNGEAKSYLQDIHNATCDVVKNGGVIELSASDYTLYLVDENNNRIPTDVGSVYKKNPHSMTIVGINDNGDYIVSTWGNEYALDPMSLNTNYGVYEVKIN